MIARSQLGLNCHALDQSTRKTLAARARTPVTTPRRRITLSVRESIRAFAHHLRSYAAKASVPRSRSLTMRAWTRHGGRCDVGRSPYREAAVLQRWALLPVGISYWAASSGLPKTAIWQAALHKDHYRALIMETAGDSFARVARLLTTPRPRACHKSAFSRARRRVRACAERETRGDHGPFARQNPSRTRRARSPPVATIRRPANRKDPARRHARPTPPADPDPPRRAARRGRQAPPRAHRAGLTRWRSPTIGERRTVASP